MRRGNEERFWIEGLTGECETAAVFSGIGKSTACRIQNLEAAGGGGEEGLNYPARVERWWGRRKGKMKLLLKFTSWKEMSCNHCQWLLFGAFIPSRSQ